MINRSRPPFLVLVVLCGMVFLLPSCSSSTAVMGTPVKELPLGEEKREVKRITSRDNREELVRLSHVKKNKVFTEVDGISEYRIGPLDVLESRLAGR